MQNVKGTYDFFGPEQAARQQVQDVLRNLFELYRFEAMESTILHELDVLTSKYAGGEEIVKEMYQLSDQGQRQLGLRYDLTIPFAKVVAMNPGLQLPYKRYEIGKVFRDGPVKRGRLREFLQCDADIVGIAGPEAEAELMQLAVEAFRRLDIPVTIRWNNRRFLGELLESVGVPAGEALSVMLTLDKIAKIGKEGVKDELLGKGLGPSVTEAILALMEREEISVDSLAGAYGLQSSEGASEVRALQLLIDETGLAASCAFDPFLSRGLSFYTGTVYEIFDASGSFVSSLGGGGRYDAIIGQFTGRQDAAYPTVGLSFGMESIMALVARRPAERTRASAVVIPIGDTLAQALRTAAALRANGIRTSLDTSGRKLRKSLASAASQRIRFVLLIGESEAAIGAIRLKDMAEQTEAVITVEEAIWQIERKLGLA
ncbi:MAG: histidine--tRNA ligase [Paenibacillus dendritiformis]|uniref:histidine--tRNA ligase n=1 Tax=Paenibacillus dendritiformis TaxID=130049 RepID=UPI00143D166A|nr:histidine--tRNA ligase [Paenibacillus dendritiformis]MDU5141036.1 histidine--tRNA ligase [Paenibacillus dendritiformis]NKI20034.1 histidine--tRNA ligase [Paenibacillus dendritiformis]NRF98273.1 histidine--tRNA ligase [Paenibacillus dendritiformis]GIO75039.1 histidine--tRNA ligase 1 [Paenibacillus dendritiformis]